MRHRWRRWLGWFCVFAGCESGNEAVRSAPLITDSAGIRVVVSRGPDRPFGATPRLAAALVPPDSALTPLPWGIAADPLGGRIYVADRERVAVFASNGSWIRDIGRSGEGPGEFQGADALTLDPYGALAVWDTRRGVVSRWSSEGDLLNERRAPVSYWGPGMAVGPDWTAAVTTGGTGSGPELTQRLVVVSAADTVAVLEVVQPMGMLRLACAPSGIPAPKVLAPSVVWTARGDTLFFVDGAAYRVDGWVRGERSTSFRRPVPAVGVDGERAARAVAEGPGPYRGFMRRCATTPDEIVRSVGHVVEASPILWLAVDPSGRLWVTRTDDALGPHRVDVLSPEGGYLGSFPFRGLVTAFLSDSVFVGLRLDVDGTGETAASIHHLVPDGVPTTALDTRPVPALRSDVREFRDCGRCPVMVQLPRGGFMMGAPAGEAPAAADRTRPEATELAERPRVEVVFDRSFAIGKFEVTFAEWDACVEAGGCTYSPGDDGWGRGSRPVIHVARRDAEEYVRWLSTRTGEDYRLPSEAEWEYAARAGTETARWWGDELGVDRAPCDGCGSWWDDDSTAPVGSFSPNPFGLHDMLGNVTEWVSDCWHPTLEGQPIDGSARVTTSPWWDGVSCERPVRRGGAWSHYPWTVRAAARSFYFPGNWTDRDSPSAGFRVARAVAGDSGR